MKRRSFLALLGLSPLVKVVDAPVKEWIPLEPITEWSPPPSGHWEWATFGDTVVAVSPDGVIRYEKWSKHETS